MALHPGYDSDTEKDKVKTEEEEAKKMAEESGIDLQEVKDLAKDVKKIYT